MKKFLFLLIALIVTVRGFGQLKVDHLLTENLVDPISIDALKPRFSWQLNAGGLRGVVQTAYEIKVTKGRQLVWHTDKVTTGQSVYVSYAGTTLNIRGKICLAGEGLGQFRKSIGMERTGIISNGDAGTCRLEGTMDHSRLCGRFGKQAKPVVQERFFAA